MLAECATLFEKLIPLDTTSRWHEQTPTDPLDNGQQVSKHFRVQGKCGFTMIHRRRSSVLQLVLLVICVFAAGLLIVFFAGGCGRLFEPSQETTQDTIDTQTDLHNSAGDTLHNDLDISIRVDTYAGTDALVFTTMLEDKGFEHWFVVYDNMLCDIMVEQGSISQISPLLFQPLIQTKKMMLVFTQPDLLSVKLETVDGKTSYKTLKVISPGSFLLGVLDLVDYGDKIKASSMDDANDVSDAIRILALLCYAHEGSYPDNLSYLEDNYGLVIDRSRFAVYYNFLGSSILPQISVVAISE